MENPEQCGLYIVSDIFFEDFKGFDLIQNKTESRPYYYALRDKTGLYWLIPMTSKVEQLREKIRREEEKRGVGKCIYYHIGKIAGKERGFRIRSMFPVTGEYISRAYTVGGKPYVVRDNELNKRLKSKATKYIQLVESGNIHPTLNILELRRRLNETVTV